MITIKQGEDYQKILILQYAETQTPVDLSGCSAYSQMRDVPGGTLVATADCSVDYDNGIVTVLYDADATEDIAEGEYGFDIWLVDSDDLQHCIYEARVKIVKPYTENVGGA